MKRAIETMEDIRLLVDTFYGKVRKNPLIGPIFDEVIGDQWPVHLEKMYRFWQTVLFGEHTYHGTPFPPHAQLPVDRQHFDTWLALWHGTLDQLFTGEKAAEAKWRGDKMAAMFLSKIDYYRSRPSTPLL
jgi:Truncated hemoglobins